MTIYYKLLMTTLQQLKLHGSRIDDGVVFSRYSQGWKFRELPKYLFEVGLINNWPRSSVIVKRSIALRLPGTSLHVVYTQKVN